MEFCEANLETTGVGCPKFDPDKYVLGGLCRKFPDEHQWGSTGKSLRRKNNTGHAGNCICCKKGWTVEQAIYRQKIKTQSEAERLEEQSLRSLNGEEWRDINGWEGEYEVSNLGQVRSIKNNLVLKPKIDRRYCSVGFYVAETGKFKRYLVHRLVAIAFIGEPPTQQHQVNHIDGNPSNNNVANLEWVTPLENTRHAIEVLKVSKVNSGNFQAGSQHKASKMTEDDVKWILDNQATMKRKDMAAAIGVSVALINDICLRRRWTHITSWYGLSD